MGAHHVEHDSEEPAVVSPSGSTIRLDLVGEVVRDNDVTAGYAQLQSLQARALRLWPQREWLHDNLVIFQGNDMILTSNFVIVDPNNCRILLNQSYTGIENIMQNRFYIKENRFSLDTNPVYLDGDYIVIGGPIDGVWYHWLFNWCPRLLLIQNLRPDLLTSPDVRILVHPRALQGPFRSVLDTFNIPAERLIAIDPTLDYKIERAYIVSFFDQQKLYPDQIRAFADHLLQNWKLTDEPEIPGVFASRQALPPPKRRIQNFDEIEPILDAFDFQVIDCGSLCAQEQARIFRAARIVVGGHGSDLSNLLFCRPGTRVIVFESAWSISADLHVGLKYLCEILGLLYFVIIVDTHGDASTLGLQTHARVNLDYVVDPRKLYDKLNSFKYDDL